MQQFQSQMLAVQRRGICCGAPESCSTAHRTLTSHFGEFEQKERLAPFFSRLRRGKDRSRLRSLRKACPEFEKLCVHFEGYDYVLPEDETVEYTELSRSALCLHEFAVEFL